jgi:hypothetical protein
MFKHKTIWIFITFIILNACSKETYTLKDNNHVPDPGTVSTLKVKNYVNKLFIDLLGRTPTELESEKEVEFLFENKLSFESREELIYKLQHDSSFVEGDSSYKIAYFNRLYNLCKSRLLEGTEDGEFSRLNGISNFAITVARLEGDSIAVFRNLEKIKRNQDVLDSRIQLRNGEITINELHARMLNNDVYDIINMNSFNFVNASFDDIFGRFPSQEEFNLAYGIIERNEVQVMWGKNIDNKPDYCTSITECTEFYEGLIHWVYLNLLGREPSANESYTRIQELITHKDIRFIQTKILKSNEYAQF